jgi:membrane associated rhomboid family serine protease
MIFPLADDNSDRASFPIINVTLIAVNVLVFVFLQGMGENLKFTYALSTVPAEISSGVDLVTADQTVLVDSIDGPQQITIPGLQKTPVPVYFTLLTSMFMHGGLMHLAGNMWFLWIFGDNIENDLGRLRYIMFYLLCGIVASLAHVLPNLTGPASLMPSLGASGAISGVMGAYLVLHPRRRVTVLVLRMLTEVPGYIAVGVWFLFQILSSLGGTESGVAYGAHIGGFVAGVIFAKPFMVGRESASPNAWRNARYTNRMR